jgi:ketosteroid isomerase-like protein
MKEAVLNHDTELRLGFFTRDAVFMPHAEANKSGIDEIRKYLIEYNARNVVLEAARIETFEFERAGDYAIEYPRFNVKWRVPELSGVASGKGIRLWKRQPGGALKIFREIATHDFQR